MWRSCKIERVLLTGWLVYGLLWMQTPGASQVIELKGARFPLQHKTDSGPLRLQGAGLLKWGIWFDVYAAAFYVDETNPLRRRLVIEYFVPIEAHQIRTAAETHLTRQLDTELLAALKPALDRLHGAIGDVDKGDRYALTLDVDQTLTLERNGIEVLRLREPGLGEAYLNLWLGEEPLNEDLRLSLLGLERRR